MKAWRTLPIACALWVVAFDGRVRAEPKPLSPADFAYGRELRLPDTPEPIAIVELPLDVYRAMRGERLSELMVFNGRGAQVPHAIRSVRSGPAEPPQRVSLALFPLTLAATQRARSGDLALEIERDAQGQVVRIAAKRERRVDDRTKAATPPQPIAAYVLDARDLPRAIVGLRVQLALSLDDSVLPLRLEASDDLVSFWPVDVDGALVQLGHGGQRIDRDLLHTPPTRAQFYRLSPAREASFPGAVSAVEVTLAGQHAPRRFERVKVRASSSSRPQVFRFDLGGPLPVDRVEIELPEQNTVVNAELWSSDELAGPYERVVRARLYRIAHRGNEERGPTLELSRRHHRYYELRVEATGGGLGAGLPTLVTYHAPDQLLVMRRGDGPFMLAYGRYETPPARFEAEDLLSLLPDAPAPTASATLGEPKLLGGPARLAPPKPPPPYKTYVIWAVLIAGVMLLGALAFHLARSGERGA